MDVRQFFRKVREIENALTEQYPLVMSLETSDGGNAGVISEVNRFNAAKMIVEGRALLATDEQKENFLAQQAFARKLAEKVEIAKRVQVAIIEDPTLYTQITTKKNNGPSGISK